MPQCVEMEYELKDLKIVTMEIIMMLMDVRMTAQ